MFCILKATSRHSTTTTFLLELSSLPQSQVGTQTADQARMSSSSSSSGSSSRPEVAKSRVVVGGKLKFKGSSKSSSGVAKLKTTSSSTATASFVSSAAVAESNKPTTSSTDFLTEAQRRHRDKKIQSESRQLKSMTTSTYRDRVEIFNAKLGQMTEHNDIPRVSAAGNG